MLQDNGRKVKQTLNYHLRKQEVKVIFDYVHKHSPLKYEIALLLMITRGLRPSEALAVNVADFSKDYTRLTYREAKTNKYHLNEVIITPVADRIRLYVEMNRFSLKDGYLFPYYTKKSHGNPFMTSEVFSSWFSSIRVKMAKKHPEFNEKYQFSTTKGGRQLRYRINVYSFRRFFETYLYINNSFNLALLKEIMHYSSKFDPMKHYIKFFHEETDKIIVMQNTFNPLSSMLINGQTTLREFT
jgi:integrase